MGFVIAYIIVSIIILIKISIPILKKQERLTPKYMLKPICFLLVLAIPAILLDYGYYHDDLIITGIGLCSWFGVIIIAIIWGIFISPKLQYKIISKKGTKTTGTVDKFFFASESTMSGKIISKKYNIMVSYTDKNYIEKKVLSHTSYDITVLSYFTSLDHLDILVYKDACIILNEVPQGYCDNNFNFTVELVDLPKKHR